MVPVLALSTLTQWELLLGASFTQSFSQGPIHTEHLWEQGGMSRLIPDYHKTGNSNKKLQIPLCQAGNASPQAPLTQECEAR